MLPLSFTASENSTCIPSLGMFVLHSKPANYSAAYNNCLSDNGQLVHIATDKRTNEMSKFLKRSISSATSDLVAFVGLNESNAQSKFFTSNKEPLECFDYRAWALGHPPEIRKHPACVVITQDASWRIHFCNKKAPYICEVLTGGPNPHVKNINQPCSVIKPNNKFMPKKTSNSDF